MITVTVVGLLLATAVLFLAVPRFKLFGDRVSSYSSVVKENSGVFHVNERFIFHLSGTRHLIYRNWDAPVSLSDLNKPYVHIRSVSCPSGTVPYFVPYPLTLISSIPIRIPGVGAPFYYVNGRWVPEREALRQFSDLPTHYIHEATKPEVGCASASGTLPPGDYSMRVVFDVYPKLHCDGSYCHANISLAGKDHFDYQRVSVSFGGEDVIDVIRRPPSWFLSLFGLPGNQYLEIETLLKPIHGYRFTEYVSNVRSRFNAARHDNYGYYYAYLMTILAAFLVPIGIFLYWWFLARDRLDPSVPEYLTNVPNPNRKPWVVNGVFDGKAGQFDANAFATTLLDLKRRGIVSISGSGDETVIEVLGVPDDLDEYERAVVNFLRAHARGNAFVPALFKRRISKASEGEFKALKKEWDYVAGDSPLAKRVAKTFIAYPSGALFSILFAGAFLLAYVGFVVNSGVLILSSFAVAIYAFLLRRLPPDVLGRWKNGYGREYSQWQAFKRFLSDLSLIRKYSEQFLSMWQDWLIYGTALGVAEKVFKALKEIRIPDIEDLDAETYLAIRTTADVLNTAYLVKSAELAAAAAARGVATGGGFGGGAGFGGGGGGAR